MEEIKKEQTKISNDKVKDLLSIEKLLDTCIDNGRKRNEVVRRRDEYANTTLLDLEPMFAEARRDMGQLDKDFDDATHDLTNSMFNLLINLADKVIELKEDIEKLKSLKCKCHSNNDSIDNSNKEGVETNE